MSKGTIFTSNTVKSLIFGLLTFGIFVGYSSRSYAAVSCTLSQETFDKVVNAFPSLDIRRTVMNMATSAVVDSATSFAFNGSLDDLTNCTAYLGSQSYVSGVAKDVLTGDASCSLSAEQVNYCKGLIASYSCSKTADAGDSRSRGSLAGLALAMGNASREPLPVNMAYFFNDSMSRVPFVGGAFAQTVTYQAPLLDAVLSSWKIFRNLAYGLIAIFMVVIGIMIMTRKKLSPQAVVTAQYALPRVVISLILITFSYPIGAFLAQAGYGLMLNIGDILITGMKSGGTAGVDNFGSFLSSAGDLLKGNSQCANGIEWITTVFLFVVSFFGVLGVGIVSVVALILGIIFFLVGWLILFFVILWTYIKMVIHIVASPLVFAVGALPGQDTMIEDWFKKMASYALALPAMVGVTTIASVISSALMLQSLRTGTAQAVYGGFMVSVFAAPFIILAGFFYAYQMPAKIEGWLGGDGGKKRR